MKGVGEATGWVKENGDYLFENIEQDRLKENNYLLNTDREANIEVTPSRDNTKINTVYYPCVHKIVESDDDVFIETETRKCSEPVAPANGLYTDKEINATKKENKVNDAVANVQTRVKIPCDIVPNNSLDEQKVSPYDNCNVACAKQAKMARDSLAHIWQGTDTNNYNKKLSKYATSVYDNMEDDLVLRVVLTKSAQCERKIIQKKLGTPENLFVLLERSKFVELKEGANNQRKRKRKWQRRYSSEGSRYRCKACPFKTSTKFKLLVHAEEHKELEVSRCQVPARYLRPGDTHDKVLYKCPDCKYTSDLKWVFSGHLNVHKSIHEVQAYRCAKCSFKTKLRSSLVRHMGLHRSRDEANVHKCPYCSFATYGKAYIVRHIKMLHETSSVELLSCNICDFKTKYEKSLKNHLLTHVPSQRKRYKCPLCPFETVHKDVLRSSHFLKHTSDESRVFGCAHCDYKSKTKDTLRKHLVTHMTVKMYKCTDCSYETKHKDYLPVHKRFVHQLPDKDRMQPCSHCPYLAKSMRHLSAHLRYHKSPEDGKMYKCEQCPYQSANSANVTRHGLVHQRAEELTWHKCDSCDYEAKSRDRLKQHFNVVHRDPSEIKWHACNQCGRKFNALGNLKRHYVVHMNLPVAKTFHCLYCPYSSKLKNDIKQHREKHRNEYFKCDQCGYRTKYNSNMKKHKRRHR